MKKFTLKKFSRAPKPERSKMFRDYKMLLTELNCVHYCSIGGHLWYHSPQVNGTIPHCQYSLSDSGVSTIRFFRVCPRHHKRSTSAFEDLDRD